MSKTLSGVTSNPDSRFQHNTVESSEVSLELKVAFSIDFGVSFHQICAWDSDVLENHEAVVLAVVSKLGTDISHLNTRKRLPCLQVAGLHHEGMNTSRLTVEDQFGEYNGVIGELTHITRPKLYGCNGW